MNLETHYEWIINDSLTSTTSQKYQNHKLQYYLTPKDYSMTFQFTASSIKHTTRITTIINIKSQKHNRAVTNYHSRLHAACLQSEASYQTYRKISELLKRRCLIVWQTVERPQVSKYLSSSP